MGMGWVGRGHSLKPIDLDFKKKKICTIQKRICKIIDPFIHEYICENLNENISKTKDNVP
jgi:UDP-glucose 6-dehydrogenase